MSFILDALKKSETERQQSAGAEFAAVPVAAGPPAAPRWLWVLAALLVVNVAVLLGLLLRPAPEPTGTPTLAETTPPAGSDAAPSFAERVITARENRPAVPEPTTTEPPRPAQSPAAEQPTPAPSGTAIPTFSELRARGDLTLGDLHLDIHVYSNEPEDRFVFVNMTKHREGSTLAEGPVLREITHDGVILEHQGSVFLLPRE